MSLVGQAGPTCTKVHQPNMTKRIFLKFLYWAGQTLGNKAVFVLTSSALNILKQTPDTKYQSQPNFFTTSRGQAGQGPWPLKWLGSGESPGQG